MNTQLLSNKQSIRIGMFYGFASVAAIWLSGLITLDSNTKYSGSLLTTALTFGMLICGTMLCWKRLNKIVQLDKLPIGQLALAGIFFSVTIGFTGGLIHYIDTAFIDTNWAQNALKASQATWAANNYSKEAIAGQIELTDTFQSSWKWAVASGIFIIIISSVLFVTVGCLLHVMKEKKRIGIA